jgi:hypothetical protein
MLVPADDGRGLSRAMVWMHENAGRLPEMGRNAQIAAAAYTAERWADTQVALGQRLTETA